MTALSDSPPPLLVGARQAAAPTAPKRVTRILKRRREPGEIATPVVSIRNQCLECCGYQPSEVELCTAPKCWLFPYRFGCKPEAAARRGKDVGLDHAGGGAAAVLCQKSGGPAPSFWAATPRKTPAAPDRPCGSETPAEAARRGEEGPP
jgi:hypothetical protein